MAFLVPLAISVVSNLLIGALSPTLKQEGTRLSTQDKNSSRYGEVLPKVYGSNRLPAKVIFSSGTREVKTSKTSKSSKKGPKTETTTYSYFTTVALAFAGNEQAQLLRVWANKKLIYDVSKNNTSGFISGDNGATFADEGRSGAPIRFYPGSEDQMPDPKIESIVNARTGEPNSCPAYRGVAYIVLDEYEVTNFGGRLPDIEVEISRGTEVVTAFNATDTGEHGGNDIDAQVFYDNVDSSIRAKVGGDSFVTVDFPTMAVNSYVPQLSNSGDGTLIGADGNEGLVVYTPGSGVSVTALVNLETGVEIATISGINDGGAYPTPLYAKVFTVDVSGEAVTRFWFITYGDGSIAILNHDYTTWGDPGCITKLDGDYNQTLPCLIGPMDGQYRTIYVLSDDDGVNHIRIREYLIDSTRAIKSKNQVFDIDGGGVDLKTALWVESSPCILMFYSQSGFNWVRRWVPDRFASQNDFGANEEQGVALHNKGWSRIFNGNMPLGMDQSKVVRGECLWLSGGLLSSVDIYDGRYFTKSISDIDASLVQSGYQFYDGVRGAIVTTTPNGYTAIFVNRLDRTAEFLTEVVTDVCLSANLLPTQFDVTALDGLLVNGMSSTTESNARSVLETLGMAYDFYGRETDYKLVFELTNSDPVRVITEDELVDVESGDRGFQRYIPTRVAENELPAKTQVTYYDIDRNYEQGFQFAKRIRFPFSTSFSDRNADYQWNLVLDAAEAKKQAERLLYTTWISRDKRKYSLGPKHMDLDPGDVVTIQLDNGKVFTDRITNADTGLTFESEIETESIYAEAYRSVALGAVGDGVPVQSVGGVVSSLLFYLDIPLLSALDEPVSSTFIPVYYGVGARGAGWSYAQLERSEDAVTYANFGFQNDDTAYGTVIGGVPVPYPSAVNTDVTNTITVRFKTGVTLTSLTDTEFLNGTDNLILIGDEIIQFRTVTMVSPTEWVLSYLRRGCRGTEWAIPLHSTADQAVLLTPASLEVLSLPALDLGAVRYYRAVSKDQFSAQAEIKDETLAGVALKPFSPVEIIREDGASDITISFTRRDRLFPVEFPDGTEVIAMSEDTETYNVYILAAPHSGNLAPTSYVRKYTVTSPTAVYLAADQTTDAFTKATDTLHVAICQVSARVGDGVPGIISLEPPL